MKSIEVACSSCFGWVELAEPRKTTRTFTTWHATKMLIHVAKRLQNPAVSLLGCASQV